ncbi:twin-arginine translocation signal domain-containing protein, partial [Candidatus Latescibacterota bacterium]
NTSTVNRRTFLKHAGAGSAAALASASTLNSASFISPEKGVPTGTGHILPSRMGITSAHEHVPLQQDPAEREKSMTFAIADLKRAKELGFQTLFEVGPTRDAAGIRDISLETGVNIVCCTGFYLLKDDQQSLNVEDFENHMRREIEDGIDGTQIRPGIIKVAANGLPITPGEKNVLIAAAHVQKRYNMPICTHAVSGCAEQQSILEQAGADPNHCYYSHVEATFGWSGRNVEQEIDYLQGVVEKGGTLSFNNFGNWNHTTQEDMARIINELTRRGFDDRMVATMDVTWSFENGNIKILWEDTNEGGKDRTYSYLLRKAVPWMLDNGIPEKSVNKFIRANPQRLIRM